MNVEEGKRQVMECPLPLWCGGVGLASPSVGEAVAKEEQQAVAVVVEGQQWQLLVKIAVVQ